MDDLSAYLGEFSAAQAPSALAPSSRLLVTPKVSASLFRPAFASALAAIKASTDALEAEYQARVARGAEDRSLGNVIRVMPDCPSDGPWGYVYRDIFDAAKENLRTLNATAYSPTSTAEQNYLWVTLIQKNVRLLRGATNISDMFLFPTGATFGDHVSRPTPEEAARSVREPIPWRDVRGSVYSSARAVVSGHTTDGGGNNPSDILGSGSRIGLQTVSKIRTTRPQNYEGAVRRALALPPNRAQAVRDAGSDLSAQMRAMVPFMVTTPQTTATERDTALDRTPAGASAADWGSDGDFRAVNTANGTFYWYPSLWLEHYRLVARVYSNLDLNTILTESFGFYAFNHNVHFASKLGMTNEQVRAIQTAAIAAQTATAGGIASGAASAINPIAGAVVAAAAALVALLVNDIGAATGDVYESPFSLFRRVPRPGCTATTAEPPGTSGTVPGATPPEAPPGATPCPAGTTGTYPNCIAPPKKSSPLVWGFGALILFAALTRK